MRSLRAPLLSSLLLVAACSSLPPNGTPPLTTDAEVEADVVAPVDRVAPRDVPLDAGTAVDVVTAEDRVAPPDLPTVTDRGVIDVGPRDTGVPDTGVRDTGPTDTGPAADVPVSGAIAMALPVIDDATRARIRELRAAGQARGNRANVLAKIGDSITESGSFLTDLGEGWYNLGAYAAVEPTIAYFRMQIISGGRNSLNRPSVCAMAGWTAARALEGGATSPLRTELAATRPAWAVVMYGTNDIDQATPDALQTNLTRVVEIIEENGTVPILSTIPDRTDSARAGGLALTMNQRIRAIAAARHIPLMDYWAALQPLPARGMDGDGIHPNVYRNMGDAQAGDFTAAGLRYGYNMRNLVTVLSLDRVRVIQ